jgi:hypothetical protein
MDALALVPLMSQMSAAEAEPVTAEPAAGFGALLLAALGEAPAPPPAASVPKLHDPAGDRPAESSVTSMRAEDEAPPLVGLATAPVPMTAMPTGLFMPSLAPQPSAPGVGGSPPGVADQPPRVTGMAGSAGSGAEEAAQPGATDRLPCPDTPASPQPNAGEVQDAPGRNRAALAVQRTADAEPQPNGAAPQPAGAKLLVAVAPDPAVTAPDAAVAAPAEGAAASATPASLPVNPQDAAPTSHAERMPIMRTDGMVRMSAMTAWPALPPDPVQPLPRAVSSEVSDDEDTIHVKLQAEPESGVLRRATPSTDPRREPVTALAEVLFARDTRPADAPAVMPMPPDSPTGDVPPDILLSVPEPSARTTTPVPWPVRQVAPFAIALALGPDASVTITLEPRELGQVEISIERTPGGEASVRVTAERPDTLALLQRDGRELERALAEVGLGGGSPSLSFGLGGGATRDGKGGGQRRQERHAMSPATPVATHDDTVSRRGLLDLAV